MAYRVGIMGTNNTGKSFSRNTIPDGENVMILAASVKAAHLFKSPDKDGKRKPVTNINPTFRSLKDPSIRTENSVITEQRLRSMYPTLTANKELSSYNLLELIKYYYSGGNLTLNYKDVGGNVVIVKNVKELSKWLELISSHMPWIHTVILPDFTHFISELISQDEFIERKSGNEAYQKYWELAAAALRNFILKSDDLRNDMIVVTEYHADFNPVLNQWEIFTSGGKMLNEKFLPTSYYDVLVNSKVSKSREDIDFLDKFEFVVRATNEYRFARSMNIFGEALTIPNDLNLLLEKVREYNGIPYPTVKAEIE